MSIANTNRDNLQEYSMIELAMIVLEKTNKALNYREIFDQVSDLKGFTEKEKQTNLALFYTDLNLDGRFLTLGAGEWGLKKWYSVEQIDEIIQTETVPVKRKKKKKKKAKEKEVLEPSIDDPDEDDDLTEVPLDIVGAAYKNTVTDEEDEDAITLGDDLIDEDDFDDEDYDEEDDDLDDENEDEDEDEDEDEE